MIDYQLIRSKRRTLSICVDQEGALVVRAPLRMPKREIEDFIRLKQRWIEQKQRLVGRHEPFRVQEGAKLPFWGGVLEVRLVDSGKVCEGPDALFLPRNGEYRNLIAQWRMQKARELLTPLAQEWSGRTGIACAKLSFGNAKRRWGSMNSRGEMRLNTALVHCPKELCEYVIVHELCHVLHPDHSPAFHARVRSFLPDADSRRQELKKYGYCTTLLDGL